MKKNIVTLENIRELYCVLRFVSVDDRTQNRIHNLFWYAGDNNSNYDNIANRIPETLDKINNLIESGGILDLRQTSIQFVFDEDRDTIREDTLVSVQAKDLRAGMYYRNSRAAKAMENGAHLWHRIDSIVIADNKVKIISESHMHREEYNADSYVSILSTGYLANKDREIAPFSGSVTFIDNNNNRCFVKYEIKDSTGEKLLWTSLSDVPDYLSKTLSMCGDTGNGSGQIYDHISSKNPAQEKLIGIWREYHLNDMCSGTEKQTISLNSEYYSKWVASIEGLPSLIGKKGDTILEVAEWWFFNSWNINIAAAQCIDNKLYPDHWVDKVFDKDCNFKVNHHSYDLQCLFLKTQGLYLDGNYKYGSKWLFKPLPVDLKEQLFDIVNEIKQFENDDSDSDFQEIMKEYIDEGDFKNVKNITFSESQEDADYDEAFNLVTHVYGYHTGKKVVALGMKLGDKLSDLLTLFEESDHGYSTQYTYAGKEYFIGTPEELNDTTREIIDNCEDDYLYIWSEAVKNKNTRQSYDDWVESVIYEDGFEATLDRWSGTSTCFTIDGDEIHICTA